MNARENLRNLAERAREKKKTHPDVEQLKDELIEIVHQAALDGKYGVSYSLLVPLEVEDYIGDIIGDLRHTTADVDIINVYGTESEVVLAVLMTW